MYVLIVDDHAVVRFGVEKILSAEFKEVRIDEASDGEKALELFRISDYDLILLERHPHRRARLHGLRPRAQRRGGRWA